MAERETRNPKRETPSPAVLMALGEHFAAGTPILNDLPLPVRHSLLGRTEHLA
jgi:hypothetical protein